VDRAETRSVVGTWELVSYVIENPKGEVIDIPFGDQPLGTLIYTADAWVSVHVMQPDRRRCRTERMVTCAPNTKIAAFDTHFSYVGHYEFDGAGIRHDVSIGSFPDWHGSSLHRSVRFDGDCLTLAGPRTASRIPVLTWRRRTGR
jgi:hypothetical protein